MPDKIVRYKFLRHELLLKFVLSIIVCGMLPEYGYGADNFFDVRGFGKIAAVSHNSESYDFRRDFGQEEGVEPHKVNFTELSNIGLQIDTRSESPVDFILQVVASSELDYRLSDAVKLAAIIYEPNTTFQFRLGRVKPRRFLYSESKNIGFTQLWTMPVAEIYGPTPSDFVDGVEANINIPLGSGYLRSNLGYGTFKVRGKEESGENNSITLTDVVNANFEYDLGSWMFRLGYTTGRLSKVKNDLDVLLQALRQFGTLAAWEDGIKLADGLALEGTRTDFYSSGLIYQDGNWDISAEATITTGESKVVSNVLGSYLSVGYHFDKITPYILLARAKDRDQQYTLNGAPPPIPGANILAQAALNTYNFNIDQKSISIGTRFDINDKSAVKFQLDHKKISENGGALWLINDAETFSNTTESAQVYTISYEFLF